MDAVVDVAKRPDEVPRRLAHGVWRTVGVRDGVGIVVLVEDDGGIRTAYPVSGAGVTRNPDRGAGELTVDELVAGRVSDAATGLLDGLGGRLSAEGLADCRELYRAGEWEEMAGLLGALVDTERVVLSQEESENLAVLRV